MKKKETPPTSEPESTATPPIETITGSESKTLETPADIKPVESITVPPIGEVKPIETAPAMVETISVPPIGNEPAPIVQAQPILPQTPHPATNGEPVARGNRSFQEWLGADWTKSNADLARAHAVTRQAVAQMRKKVEQHNAGQTPTFSDVTKQDITQVNMVEKVIDYDVMAAMVFDMSTGLLTTTFGPEWQPREAKEREAVCGALKTYFQSKNAQDIPPGLMLTAVVIAYAGPRLREPNTSSKLQMAWTWFKLKVSKFRKKKP